MSRIPFLILLLVSIPSISRSQVDPLFAIQLQEHIDQFVLDGAVHGVSASLIMPDGSEWNGVSGMGAASLEITDTTLFHGASTMKMNIAVLLLLLDEEGLLDLDASWDEYVDLDVSFDPTITVRQLISNTSGIADYLEIPGSGNYVTNNFNYAFTPQEILENIVSDSPDFGPGTDFWYSSSNFVLAALIAETVTGNPVQDELRTRIWEPLGMNHTYFGGFENYDEPRAGVWWNFGDGLQDYSDESETSMLTYSYGCANMVSRPSDLAIFARAVLDGDFLSPQSLEEMLQISPFSYDDWSAGYGLGVHNAYAFGDNSVMGHDGYFTSMTDMFHSYDYGFTLVTMTNTQAEWFEIFNDLYYLVYNHIESNVAEMTGDHMVKIYPNPAVDLLYAQVPAGTGNADVSIYNQLGILVYSSTVPHGNLNLSIDVSELHSGLYNIQIGFNTGEIVAGRFFKN